MTMKDLTPSIEDEIQTRMKLYDFSVGKQTFSQWLAGILPSIENKRVLELGCGDGTLWRHLLPRWSNCDLSLTDVSEDILDVAQRNLEPFSMLAKSVHYSKIDFNVMSLVDQSYDVVIANHNLFYADDVALVLQQIAKALAPGGILVTSTVGRDHLTELATLLRSHNPSLAWGSEEWSDCFGLENGVKHLSKQFQYIDQYEYDNRLHVSTIEPVMQYLKKTGKGLLRSWVIENEDLIRTEIETEITGKGFLRLTPHSGFFVAQKA